MSLFEGTAPPNIETTKSLTATAPKYLTDYLSELAKAGTSQLGSIDPTTGKMTMTQGKDLVAPQGSLATAAYANAPTALARYEDPLEAAMKAGQAGGAPITAADISGFYDPYQKDVIDEMSRQSALNVQRNVLPMLRGAFAGSGGFGGRRYAGATGQALADIQANLLGEQAALRSKGFTSALDAALREKGLQTQAASALTGVGTAEQQAAINALKTGAELGQQQQAFEQAKIEAPLTRALNVAQLLRGYTYPTETVEKYVGPANVYGPSPLSQIAGLGTLLGSAFNRTIDPKTGQVIEGFGGKMMDKAGDVLGDIFSGVKGFFD
jgi:hypothetical protein